MQYFQAYLGMLVVHIVVFVVAVVMLAAAQANAAAGSRTQYLGTPRG